MMTHIPECNIGLVGHVDTGKTSLTKALSGKWTDTYSEELRRGITIRLGYADVSLYKVADGSYSLKETEGGKKNSYVRTVSLVDAPGHETLMATVLSGAAVMDGALLLVAANEPCPQPQTREHLAALDIVGVKNIVIAQNKIDMVSAERAMESFEEIKAFVKGTVAEGAPIIPISAQHNVNIPILIAAIEKHIPTPKRDEKAAARAYIVRSFDVNRPGTPIKKLKGGVLGGSVVQGTFSVGDEIELIPGIYWAEKFRPITTKLVNVVHGGRSYKSGKPGGLLGFETTLDPSFTKSDKLAGAIVGPKGSLPPIRKELRLRVFLLDRSVGGEEKVVPPKKGEPLMITISCTKTAGVVTGTGKEVIVSLRMPVGAEAGQRAVLSRMVQGRWRLIGHGLVQGES